MPHVSHGRTRGTVQSPHVTLDYDRAVEMQADADRRFYSSWTGIVYAGLGFLAAFFVCVVLPCMLFAAITGSALAGWVAFGVIVLVLVLIGVCS